MAGLILRKEEFFPSATQAVAVADRYPQNVFAEHTHEFCELVLVWRGNGLHVLNDRPWRITRGDLFYIRAEDKHSYASVNDLVLQNIIYCPERLQLNFDWAGLSRPFVLERFCEQEGGSERALRQQFRQQTGMTINHYLRQLRICHAQYLLQHTERLIGDIAMQCGFEDSNYFSVVFSREIGMSPGQWRQRSRAAA